MRHWTFLSALVVAFGCGSFGEEGGEEPVATTTEAGVDGGADGVVDATSAADGSAPDGGAIPGPPPGCPLADCPTEGVDEKCDDDACDAANIDFPAIGSVDRSDGTCRTNVEAGGAAYSSTALVRTSERQYAVLELRIVTLSAGEDRALAAIAIDGQEDTMRFEASIQKGLLALCERRAGQPLRCTPGVPVPGAGARLQLYGVVTTNQPSVAFALRVDCGEPQTLDASDVFGPGRVRASVGCLPKGATPACTMAVDDLVFFARPAP